LRRASPLQVIFGARCSVGATMNLMHRVPGAIVLQAIIWLQA
jgi:hypothetical protein